MNFHDVDHRRDISCALSERAKRFIPFQPNQHANGSPTPSATTARAKTTISATYPQDVVPLQLSGRESNSRSLRRAPKNIGIPAPKGAKRLDCVTHQ
ncbi:hypothetical protein [Sphingomonas sp. SRS2]|uniref:hypothetical protein n=1 Tax=Sphingomonas sp. SRS2 TaxID=133190 RepID=UPI001F46E273|nr:hypothetical protein [Sphingomonas sp. SRS2]